VKHGGLDQAADLTRIASSGRTSFKADPAVPRPLYRVVGYRVAGNMAVRVDIVERLADCIRPLVAWRPTPAAPNPPEGAVDGNGFRVTVTMTSLLGCSGEDFASVLRALGYRMERRPAPPPEAPVEPAAENESPGIAATEPLAPAGLLEDGGDAAPFGVGEEDGTPEVRSADGPDDAAEAIAEAPEGDAALAAAQLTVPMTAEPAPETTDAMSDLPAAAMVEAAVDAMAEAVVEGDAPSPPADGEVVGATGDVPNVDVAAEPAFIEIWRPHRFGRRPEQRKGRPRPSRDGPQEARPEAQSVPAQAEAGDSRPPRRDRGKDVRRAERPGGDQKGRPPRHGHGPRRDGQDRPPRPERQERPDRQERPERQKQADPLSPFAALAALKAQLEAQKRDG
jgi:ATP-dependent RNA helicase SUPV3L1/SUV3